MNLQLSDIPCLISSSFIYYFLLVSILWMLEISIVIYLFTIYPFKFIHNNKSKITNFKFKCILPCWGKFMK